MSLILCRPESVKHPYYIEHLGLHIASSQELCYVIYHYPMLAMGDFVNDALIQFIRDELEQTFLAGKLAAWKKSSEDSDELLIMILQECYYYTAKEIQAFRQKILSYRRMKPVEFMKAKADSYFEMKQYGTAIRYYEEILENWRLKSLSDDFTAAVWNNIGASYAGIFWFEKAMTAYDMSYNFKKEEATLKRMYQLTLFNPELKIKERCRIRMTEEQKKAWKEEFETALKEAGNTAKMSELTALFEREPSQRLTAAAGLLNRWKKEYRMMI